MSDQGESQDIENEKTAPPDDQGGEGAQADPKGEKEGSEDKAAKKPKAAVEPDVAHFGQKVEISCKAPLPIYDNGDAKAYRAYSKDQNRVSLIALVCAPDLVPRMAAADVYKSIISPDIAALVLHGVVYWPPTGREHYVYIYQDNLGQPLLEQGKKGALGWKQDDVMPIVLRPMIGILQDFRDKDFVHGNIRPHNMFGGSAQGKPSKIILGDCLSNPASYAQPSLYESVSRAMADPIARGKGTAADDLYALGVSIAVLMRQNDPLAGLSEKEILRAKLMQGTYAAITGKDRFKGEILELLRGLLLDDPSQRWTIDEVISWMDGRRLSPKQSLATKKAPRPFPLGEERYSITPMLAMDVEKNSKELKRVVEDGSLENWIERSLEDEPTALRYEKALIDARQQSSGAGYEQCLASNISIALHPDAPLRFKGLNLIGDGIGMAMARAIANKQSISSYAEVFLNSLVLNWLNVQNGTMIDVTGLFGRFEKCRRYLKTSKFGEGVERAVYVLCPEAPCLSETVHDYFVVGADDLLRAFEDLCKKGKAPATFLDKHVVAFLYEKEQKVIEPYLYDLNTHENHRVTAANLKCLAAIQKRYATGNMPALAKVLAPRLQTVVKRYHDRRVQEKLKESVAEFQGTGDLTKIASILDNAEVSKKDFKSFKRAMLEYSRIEEERQNLEMRLQDKDKFGIGTGKEVAAIFSSVLALILILGSAFLFLSDKNPF